MAGVVLAPPQICDLISRLLCAKVGQRLGCGKGGAVDIKNHPFFKSIAWTKLRDKQLSSPWKPRIKNPLDTSNFDAYDERDYIEPYRGKDGVAANWDKDF